MYTTQWVILLCDPDIAEFMQFSHEMNGETGYTRGKPTLEIV